MQRSLISREIPIRPILIPVEKADSPKLLATKVHPARKGTGVHSSAIFDLVEKLVLAMKVVDTCQQSTTPIRNTTVSNPARSASSCDWGSITALSAKQFSQRSVQ